MQVNEFCGMPSIQIAMQQLSCMYILLIPFVLNTAVMATGIIWARYSTVITPVSYIFFFKDRLLLNSIYGSQSQLRCIVRFGCKNPNIFYMWRRHLVQLRYINIVYKLSLASTFQRVVWDYSGQSGITTTYVIFLMLFSFSFCLRYNFS